MDDRTGLFSLLALAVSVASAIVATRAAGVARKAQTALAAAELRTAQEEVALGATDCSLLFQRIQGLHEELRAAIVMSEVARGIKVNSSSGPFNEHARAQLAPAEELYAPVREWLHPKTAQVLLTIDEASQARITTEAARRRLTVIADAMQLKLNETNEIAAAAYKARSRTDDSRGRFP